MSALTILGTATLLTLWENIFHIRPGRGQI